MREAGLKLLLLDCPEKVDPAWTYSRGKRVKSLLMQLLSLKDDDDSLGFLGE